MRRVQQEKYYEIKAIVVLPEHLHCIWQLPPQNANYPQRWKEIKKYFTQGVNQAGIHLEKNNKGEYNLWQRRYWEHTIRDERDFENHVNYIHYNPVKHGYVKRVKDWPYSSFHQYVRKEIISEDWGGVEIEEKNIYGYGE